MIRRSRGSTVTSGFVVVPATGIFEQQLKLSDAVSHVPGHTCPGTAIVPCNWLQVFDPSCGREVGEGVGTGVATFVRYLEETDVTGGAGVVGAGCAVFPEVHPADRMQRMIRKTAGFMKRHAEEVIRIHLSGLLFLSESTTLPSGYLPSRERDWH